jgi:trigger factor
LQISVDEPKAWNRKLVITVPAGRVKTERSKVTKQLAKRVKMPGFRKGKVPTDRIESRYGPDIDRETQQQLIDAAFRQAIKEKELDPISEPRVANVSYDRESEFTFEVSFDIQPEIKLARLGGFRLNRPEISVGEAEIEEQLVALQKQQALWKPVERRPVTGDTVEVEITPLDSGDGATQEAREYKFALGEGQAIQEVEAAIMTLDPGSADDFEIGFPDDFPDESQRGTSQNLRIDLRQVLEQELPTLDDEFAKSVGDLESLEALKDAVSADLLRYKEHEVQAQLDQTIVAQVIEANPFEVPGSMVDRYAAALVGQPPEGTDPDLVTKALEEARPSAEWGIKRTLVIQQIAADQGFEATKEEVQKRVEDIAKAAGRPVGEIRGRLAKSGELRDLEHRITEQKVFEFLREQSEIEVGS